MHNISHRRVCTNSICFPLIHVLYLSDSTTIRVLSSIFPSGAMPNIVTKAAKIARSNGFVHAQCMHTCKSKKKKKN